MFLFLPIGTTRPRLRVPYVTYTLMGLCAAMFAAEVALEGAEGWAFVPAEPSPFTWLAGMFMHADPIHLGGNMLFLWLFGTLAEDVLGPWVFLAFYVGGGIGATALDVVVSAIWTPDALLVPHLGASGAIAGIMGLAAVAFARTKVRVWYFGYYVMRGGAGVAEIAAPIFLALWVAWQIAMGLVDVYVAANIEYSGGVAHWAHVGGFAVGMAGAFGIKLRKKVVRGDIVSGLRVATDPLEGYSQLGEAERMAKESPEDAQVWYALGRAREVAGLREKAGQAYEKAMTLFLQERRHAAALRAYRGVATYGSLAACPEQARFRLAGALEEMGKPREALAVFRQVAAQDPGSQLAETALMRASEIAQNVLGDVNTAAECYRLVMEHHPQSRWCVVCRQRLRALGPPGQPPRGGRRKPGEGGDEIRYVRR